MKRYLGKEEQHIVDTEFDMLKGNVCRMCTADDLVELEAMYKYAKNRLDHIYSINRGLFF